LRANHALSVGSPLFRGLTELSSATRKKSEHVSDLPVQTRAKRLLSKLF